jgi:hypothetical protein
MQFRAPCAGRTDERNREAGVVGHGDQYSFSVARVAFETDLFRIHRFVGFEIIEDATCAPTPCA